MHMRICSYIHTYIYIHIHVHTYIHTPTHIHILIHTHIHTYIHTHTYTHTHIHIYTQLLAEAVKACSGGSGYVGLSLMQWGKNPFRYVYVCIYAVNKYS
jgi:hypothetical protein